MGFTPGIWLPTDQAAIVLVAEQLRRQAEDGEETLVGCLVARFERSLVDLEHFVDHFEVAVDPVVGEIGSDRAYFRALSDFFKLTLLVVQSGRPHVVLRNHLALRRLLQNLDAFLELLSGLLVYDPAQRLSPAQAMQSRFIRGGASAQQGASGSAVGASTPPRKPTMEPSSPPQAAKPDGTLNGMRRTKAGARELRVQEQAKRY